MKNASDKWIKACVKKGDLDYSFLAKSRMLERKIEDEIVVDCILNGKVIEYQKQYKDVHVLFQEATDKEPEIYVIVAAAYPNPVIVTVCRTMIEVWGDSNGILKRRQRV